MSDLRPRGIPVMVNGEERHLLFTLNAIDAIQDKYEKTLSEVLDDIINKEITDHTMRDVLLILLNDEVERENYKQKGQKLEEATEREIGWMIGLDNQGELVEKILRAYGASLPEPEEEDPNQESGQMND